MIEYEGGPFGVNLRFSQKVVGHFLRHQQQQPHQLESGGQLFAQFRPDAVCVERATGPRLSDRRTPLSYTPNPRAERREIRRMFKRHLHYIGDWHTHHQWAPAPSARDVAAMCALFVESTHELPGLTIVIVGRAPEPEGLFVGVCDGRDIRRLTPASLSSEDPTERRP